ncbi:hypothetical protein BDN71DRAFT_1510911 [Pleurotus eryngii]|uniref:Uncharacterized protein n=1 Tax=Pleurotus eryngii TaxID=5323 RepID=A0A9P6D377_PLEER|nr:hypothetical protein BDN71DRAFT_1510911 [Pleurotus eryngii]
MRTCHACPDGRHLKQSNNKKQIGNVTARRPASRPSSVLSGKHKALTTGTSRSSPSTLARPVPIASLPAHETPSVNAGLSIAPPIALHVPHDCDESTHSASCPASKTIPSLPSHETPSVDDMASTALPTAPHVPHNCDESTHSASIPVARTIPSLPSHETPSAAANLPNALPPSAPRNQSLLVVIILFAFLGLLIPYLCVSQESDNPVGCILRPNHRTRASYRAAHSRSSFRPQ